MSAVSKPSTRVSVQEYLRAERLSATKHEYDDGEVLAMAGASRPHVLVSTNVVGELRARLRGGPCVAYTSDLRVRLPGRPRYVYPDATVICGEAKSDPDDDGLSSFLNPKVVVEVLSPATEQYDRGKKFERYRRIESLQEYVLIAQDAARVETYARQPDGWWRFDVTVGIESTIRLRSLGIDLPMSELYANVDLPPDEADPEPELGEKP